MTPSQKQRIVDSVLSLVDKSTAPDIMNKSNAKSVIEQIVTELEYRIDCINDEMKAEG